MEQTADDLLPLSQAARFGPNLGPLRWLFPLPAVLSPKMSSAYGWLSHSL